MAQDNSGAWQVAGAAVTAMGNYAGEVAKNKRQWRYQQKAMAQQDIYNRELWDYQNAYNTPQAQMQRLKDAGLNPRLIYGPGAAANSNAGPIEPAQVPTRQAASPHIPEVMGGYLQARQMDAQYKATLQNIEAMRTTQSLNQVRTALENMKLFRENLRAKNYEGLAQAELDSAKFVALRQGELFANERTKGNLMDQLQELRSKQMTGIELDNVFKQHRNELAKLGIYTHDHPAFRVLIRASERMGIDLGDLLSEGANKLKYLLDLGK